MTLSPTLPQHPEPAEADVLLTDGTVAVIRGLAATDRPGLEALHDEASDDSVRFRFFSTGRRAGHDYVAHLFDGGGAEPVASLVATVRDRVVALATAERAGPDSAEVAFMVAEASHGHGLGSLLLEHLAAVCRDRGVRRFVAEVLSENHPMLRVFLDAGFTISRRADMGTVHVEMGTAASSRAIAAADEREFRAEAASLAPLLYPRSVAVTGARRDGSGVGAAVLDSIRAGGYDGPLCVIHPEATSVDGVTAYPRLVDVPEHVDLVIVAVPADRVLAALRDAAEAGVPAAVVISSGFEELGDDGGRLQREMLQLARDHSMRLVGPNCLGVLSNQPGLRLNATFGRAVPPAGGLAVASQSGGVGIALIDLAEEIGLGVTSFVSLGNKADVSGNDLLAAWFEDPHVTAAALYLESFGNAPKFARLARRFAERKPLLAVVGGRSSGGRRAGASHTAAAATSGVGVDALFAQAGVIGCRSAEELAETALLLAEQPLPGGPRVAVVSNAGGMGVLAADDADECGLVVPQLSDSLSDLVARHVSGTVGTSNPVDAGAGAAPEDVAAITGALLASDEIDAVLVVLVRTNVSEPAPLVAALTRVRAEHPDKPVLLVPMGGLDPTPEEIVGLTRYRSVSAAIRSLGKVVRYAEWLRVPREQPPEADVARGAGARALAAAHVLDPESQDGWLPIAAARELLAPYGLEPVGRVAQDPLSATQAAVELGFPVAVKVADQNVVHKTDRGLVRVGLGSVAEVLSTVRAFEDELARPEVPVLVQSMVRGVEIALGIVRDPVFGPLVMVAAGGVATELWADRVFLIPPLNGADAARALRSLRIWPLLDGYRGSSRVDVTALEELVVALGAIAAEVPQIAELDLNPVVATADGCALVDVKVRLAPWAAVNAGVPRQLRRPG